MDRRLAQNRIYLAIALTAFVSAAAGALYFGALTDSPSPAGLADPSDAALVALGAKVYQANCASCHGGNLEGESNWHSPLEDGSLRAPPHDETGHTWHHPDQLLFQITKHGGQSIAPKGFKSNMPAFGESLSDREIFAALAFIKSRWPREVLERQTAMNGRGN